MLPAEFESAAFHLGGERSILLSYGSVPIWDFGFRSADCQVLRIVSDQRTHVVAVEFFAPVEKIEFDDEQQPDDFAA